jgi:hypothetical protein
VSDVSGGDKQTLCIHLPTGTLSRLTGDSLVLFHSVPDPQDPRRPGSGCGGGIESRRAVA